MIALCILLFTALTANAENSTNKVIGGHPAPEGSRPYQVSIRLQWYGHVCGGSIISSKSVLTAAHCVTDTDGIVQQVENYKVAVGSNQLTHGELISVSEFKLHSEFELVNNVAKHDIAIIVLDSEITLDDNVSSVAWQECDVMGDTPCSLSGWGSITCDGAIPNNLQLLQTETLDIILCKRYYKFVDESYICTKPSDVRSAAQADSGNPLVTLNGRQIGILTMTGVEFCGLSSPIVYTNIAYYSSWIRENFEE